MRANERTDERVAQYFRLYSCLFQTTVPRSSVNPASSNQSLSTIASHSLASPQHIPNPGLSIASSASSRSPTLSKFLDFVTPAAPLSAASSPSSPVAPRQQQQQQQQEQSPVPPRQQLSQIVSQLSLKKSSRDSTAAAASVEGAAASEGERQREDGSHVEPLSHSRYLWALAGMTITHRQRTLD